MILPKANGAEGEDGRWVVDLRRVNALAKSDAYRSLPISTIIDQLRDARYLPSIDLRSAFFQVELDKPSREKTAFVVPGRGLFQFTRMPQGLNSSAAAWQRLIDRVFGFDLQLRVFAYLDDIIIVSSDFDSHLDLVNTVLSRLEAAGLTINFEKCKFCLPELRYLGYVVGKDGLKVSPEKISAILDLPKPTNITETKRFIGLASRYRRFVPNFSTIMAPITNLTKGVKLEKGKGRKGRRMEASGPFMWTDECDAAFKEIKERLVSAPVLACPDFNREMFILCDASSVGLGAILSHNADGTEVIAYASRMLTDAERKYSTSEQECLAVLWAIEKFRCYVEGTDFTVVTDHYSLLWLDRLKNPQGRLARWAVTLQQYRYTIVHRKGKEHLGPDCLSRAPLCNAEDKDTGSLDLIEVGEEPRDQWYNELVAKVEQDPSRYPHFRIRGKQLFKNILVNREEVWVRLVPSELRGKVLEECHDDPVAGHFGVKKTIERIRRLYLWPTMRRDVREYVLSCEVCLAYKPVQSNLKSLMGNPNYVNKPFQLLSADLIGPLPRSNQGFQYLHVVTCFFSKYVWSRPLRSATAGAVKGHLEEIFLRFGAPNTIIVDNGVQYRSDVFGKLCEKYGVSIRYSYFYHPQANPTERVNKVYRRLLGSYVKDNHRLWDKYVEQVTAAINSSIHVTGYSPHRLIFGDEIRLNGNLRDFDFLSEEVSLAELREAHLKNFQCIKEVYAEVTARIRLAFQRNAVYYNKNKDARDLEVGQVVWRRSFFQSDKAEHFSKKLAPRWIGPLKVVEKKGSSGYILQAEDGSLSGPWHIQDLVGQKGFRAPGSVLKVARQGPFFSLFLG